MNKEDQRLVESCIDDEEEYPGDPPLYLRQEIRRAMESGDVNTIADRAAMERAIGATCIKGIYLDELDPNAGREQATIVPECGIACEMVEDLR